MIPKQIGGGFVLIHRAGTYISGRLGRNCTVLQNVTIGGAHGHSPVLGDNVYVGAGAIIIGDVHIGNNVTIGAGAIVVNDIPDNCTVVCDKAHIISRKEPNQTE